jgi:transcriptional regulator with AAA-type ATPase domain
MVSTKVSTKISREDFVFAIGFEGSVAMVDGKAKKEFGRLSTMELAEKGLYKSAFASALYAKKPEEMKSFIAFFNAKAGTSYTDQSQLSRLFGVYLEEVGKTLVL